MSQVKKVRVSSLTQIWGVLLFIGLVISLSGMVNHSSLWAMGVAFFGMLLWNANSKRVWRCTACGLVDKR